MQWLELSTHNCPVKRTLDIVGDRWSLLIIREALNDVRRFDDIRGHIGISEAVLAARLRKLVDLGVLEARPYREAGHRTRNEYRLTDKGRDFYQVVIALMEWGDKYAADEDGPMLDLRHAECGEPVTVEVTCAAGHRDIAGRDIDVERGPSGRLLAKA